MKTIELGTLALHDNLECHKETKAELLSLIDEANFHTEYNKNNYYNDSISKLDWNSNLDFDREWVKLINPYLKDKFNYFAKKLNYQSAFIKSIWFQQYVHNDYHGWHTHGDNYTGVYYLEFPEGSPKTELVDQKNIHRKITIDAKEGDIVIFPSFIIHRAPKVKNVGRKTIISFNIEFNCVNPDIFPIIDS